MKREKYIRIFVQCNTMLSEGGTYHPEPSRGVWVTKDLAEKSLWSFDFAPNLKIINYHYH